MGRAVLFFLGLSLLSAPVWARDGSWAPEPIFLPSETYDWMAVVTWEPAGVFPAQWEYRVEAGLDPDFVEIASSSAWLGWEAWSFILSPLPEGKIYIRVGGRLLGEEEVFWSGTAVTEQKGPMHPYSPPSKPRASLPPLASSSSSSSFFLPRRPVVFVHGFNGRPWDWENEVIDRDYVGLLEKEGFWSELIGLYSYADYNQDGVYDAQGEIRGIAQDLPGMVEELSQAYQERGGDGQVDMVAFSLGGLVSRAYFSSPQFDHRVRKFIDIASPHQGVYLAKPVNWLDSLPFKGPQVRKAFLQLTSQLWNRVAGETGRPVDFNSPALQEVIPESRFLKELNQLEKTPQSLDYYCLYGDIHATFNQKLFHWTLRSKKFSLGDLLITPESATGIPGDLCQDFGFIDEKDFEVKMIRGQLTPFLEIIAPLDSLRFWHGKMIKQKEIKDKVLELLGK